MRAVTTEAPSHLTPVFTLLSPLDQQRMRSTTLRGAFDYQKEDATAAAATAAVEEEVGCRSCTVTRRR